MSVVVYVSGPLTSGDLLENVRTAVLAGRELRRRGHVPVIPHLSALEHLIAPQPYEEWMRGDLAILERCDVVLRLPGVSPGADRECAHARAIGVPVVEDVERIVGCR